MLIQKDTPFYVVSSDGATKMSLESLYNAFHGGLSVHDIQIFTDEVEAKLALEAANRRGMAATFEDDDVLKASYMALLDEDREIVSVRDFFPHTTVAGESVEIRELMQ